MANPQTKDGHVEIANDLWEALMGAGLNRNEYRATLCILRYSYGFKQKYARLKKKDIADLTRIPLEKVAKTLTNLEKKNIIKIAENNGYIYFHKDYEKWQLAETLTFDEKWRMKVAETSTKNLTKRQVKLDETSTSTSKKSNNGENSRASKERKKRKESIYSLFDFWNSLKIMVHRDKEKFKPNLNAILEKYSEKEIRDAMQNYKIVLEDDKYFWTHKWELRDFLQRGLDRFLSTNKPLENFLKEKSNEKQPQPTAPYH